ELDRLGAQHEMREIDVPRMRRHVRTLGHVARVAQVALIDHLPEVLLGHAVDLQRGARVDEIEQGGKRSAEVHAPPAAMADVEDALELGGELRFVVEVLRTPGDGVSGWSLEAPFAESHGRDARSPASTGAGPAGRGRRVQRRELPLVGETVESFLEPVSVRALR